MNTEEIRPRLISAATAYDEKQSKKKFYNPHAIGIYFKAVDGVISDIKKGFTPRQALMRRFCDRLLSHMLKAIGEADFTKEEKNNSRGYYFIQE